MTSQQHHATATLTVPAGGVLDGTGRLAEMTPDRPYFVGRFRKDDATDKYDYYDHLNDRWTHGRYIEVEYVAAARTRDEAIMAIVATTTGETRSDAKPGPDQPPDDAGRTVKRPASLIESLDDHSGAAHVSVADLTFVVTLPDFTPPGGSDKVGVCFDDHGQLIHMADVDFENIGALLASAVRADLALATDYYVTTGVPEAQAQQRAAAELSPEGGDTYSYAEMTDLVGDVAARWRDYVDTDNDNTRPSAWHFDGGDGWYYQISADILQHARAMQTVIVDVPRNMIAHAELADDITDTGVCVEAVSTCEQATLSGSLAQWSDLRQRLAGTAATGNAGRGHPGAATLINRIDALLSDAYSPDGVGAPQRPEAIGFD